MSNSITRVFLIQTDTGYSRYVCAPDATAALERTQGRHGNVTVLRDVGGGPEYRAYWAGVGVHPQPPTPQIVAAKAEGYAPAFFDGWRAAHNDQPVIVRVSEGPRGHVILGRIVDSPDDLLPYTPQDRYVRIPRGRVRTGLTVSLDEVEVIDDVIAALAALAE